MTTRISKDEFKVLSPPQKRQKYGNKIVVVDGITFHSKKEADRYLFLKARQDAGEISHLELQPVFKLYGNNREPLRYDSNRQPVYKADFAYFDGEHRIVEDVKSKATKTPLYKLKKAIVQNNYPAVKIIEV